MAYRGAFPYHMPALLELARLSGERRVLARQGCRPLPRHEKTLARSERLSHDHHLCRVMSPRAVRWGLARVVGGLSLSRGRWRVPGEWAGAQHWRSVRVI